MSGLTGESVYETRLGTSGKLKLRAKSLLADSDPDAAFEASVLLHEAARVERAALDSLEDAPPETTLASTIEQCWCLVAAKDPHAAAKAWGAVLEARRHVEPSVAESMLERIQPAFEKFHRAFLAAMRDAPVLRAMIEAEAILGGTATQQARLRKEIDNVLREFQGATYFWWFAYRLAEAADDKKVAWQSIRRARLLTPDNPRFEGLSLLVASWALQPAEADTHLAAARPHLGRRGPELCLMYALAEISLARRDHHGVPGRYARALDAAEMGTGQRPSEAVHRNLRAVQLLLADLRAGRTPTMDILFRAGMGELAATELPNANVIEFLATKLRREAA